MTESYFCATCGSDKDRAYSVHCDSCNKLVQTGTAGATTRKLDDVNHATVEVLADHVRLTVCAECIHKLGQPFVDKLIELGARQLHDPTDGNHAHTVLTPLAFELRQLEGRAVR